MFREEKGSAFLLVVFMMLLFTLIGVAVLGATVGGAKRTQKTEDNLQTVHLADKALSEAIAHIMARFDDQSISPSELTQNVEQFIADFRKNGEQIMGSELDPLKNPGYMIKEICMLDVPSEWSKTELYCTDHKRAVGGSDPGKTDRDEPYLTSLRVTAEAEVNGVKRELTQEVTLDTFPDFLRYAMGSEGDVIINGAPYFKGNIYAGNDLKLQNVADYYRSSSKMSQRTQFFYVDPVEGAIDDSGNGKVQVHSNGNIKFRTDNVGQYETLFTENYSDPGNQYHGLQNVLEFTETKKFISIDVEQSFVDKAFDALGPGAPASFRDELWNAYKGYTLDSAKANALLTKLKEEFSAVYPDYEENRWLIMPTRPAVPADSASTEELKAYYQLKDEYNDQIEKLNERLSHLTGPVIFDGDLIIGKELKQIYVDLDKKGTHDWLIVNGDLVIQNDTDTPIPIRANILVKGKVRLVGKVNMDSTLFSLDSVNPNEIVDAQIRGLEVEGKKRELVMIANGPIDIYRVDSFQRLDEEYSPASKYTLDAFFYTDKEAELYGVGSLLWIYGGFFAKKGMTINAVLGDTGEIEEQKELEFDRQDDGDQHQARFVIEYNKDVFINQLAGLPRVNKIKVNIGQKKLLPVN